jgi:Xaa-Pro aminopeptidase
MSERLNKLRALMLEHKIDCYVLPHGDNHNSEYLAACDERIKFISGFSGSNGICVVTQKEARMWTDGRYYLAAGKQLFEGWTMMKMEANEVTWFKWAEDNCTANELKTVGLDYTQYPASMFATRFDPLTKKGLEVKSTENLVDKVWGDERPSRPCTSIW